MRNCFAMQVMMMSLNFTKNLITYGERMLSHCYSLNRTKHSFTNPIFEFGILAICNLNFCEGKVEIVYNEIWFFQCCLSWCIQRCLITTELNLYLHYLRLKYFQYFIKRQPTNTINFIDIICLMFNTLFQNTFWYM